MSAGEATPDRGQHVVETGRLPLFDRTLSEAVQEAHDITERAKAEHKPEWTFLLFSGGNDSAVLLDTMAEHADAIVHVNTGIGIPEANEHARRVAAAYGVDFIEKHPPVAYEELVLDNWGGMPGPGAHYLTFINLKERCIEAVIRENRSHPRKGRFLLLTGARAAESKRRMGHGTATDRKGGQVWTNPLWHVEHAEMRAYRAEHDLSQSEVAANLHMSGECLCGAMADQGPERSERELIRFFYPEFDRRLCDLEEECRRRGLAYTEWGVKRPDIGNDKVGPMCHGCENRSLFSDDDACEVSVSIGGAA